MVLTPEVFFYFGLENFPTFCVAFTFGVLWFKWYMKYISEQGGNFSEFDFSF
jgi:hypothetical protein